LRKVEALPEEQAQALLPPSSLADEELLSEQAGDTHA
jgi:hypothetical protein